VLLAARVARHPPPKISPATLLHGYWSLLKNEGNVYARDLGMYTIGIPPERGTRAANGAHVTRIGYTFINVRVIARIPIGGSLYNFI